MSTSFHQITTPDQWWNLDGNVRLLISSFGSLAAFTVLSLISHRLLPPPPGARRWLWRNRLLSFLHAAIVSVFVLYSFYTDGASFLNNNESLLEYKSLLLHFTVSFSIGYFAHDLIDNILFEYRGTVQNNAILAHHVVVIAMFSLFAWLDSYLAYLALTLLTEVNSIFLHLRKLLQLKKFEITHWAYIINNFLNVSTFLLMRVGGQLYMIYRLVRIVYIVHPQYWLSGLLAMIMLAFVNIALANSLFASDVRQWRKLQILNKHGRTNNRKNSTPSHVQ